MKSTNNNQLKIIVMTLSNDILLKELLQSRKYDKFICDVMRKELNINEEQRTKTQVTSTVSASDRCLCTLSLTKYSVQKLPVVKAVQDITGTGLKEAKELVDSIPFVLKSSISLQEAEDIQKQLENRLADHNLEFNIHFIN